MKRILLLFIGFYCCSVLSGQNNKLDSLDKIAWAYRSNNPDTAIILAEKEYQLAKQIRQKKSEGSALKILGIAYMNKGNYSKSLDYFQKALTIFEKQEDQHGQADCYSNIGNLSYFQSDYPKALEFYLHALKIMEEIGNKQGIGNCYTNIGIIYGLQSEYAKALDYFQKALKIDREGGDKEWIGSSYMNIGNVYGNQANYSRSLESYSSALKMYEEAGNRKGIALCYANIGSTYGLQSNFSKALEYQLKSLKIEKEIGNSRGLGCSYNYIGDIYIKTLKFNLAIQYSDSGLWINKKIGDIDQERTSCQNLADAYARSGLYKEAYTNHVQFKLLTDSVFNTDKSKQLGDMKTRFEVEKKETELKSKTETQQAISAAVAGILILVIIFSIFLFRRFKITQQQKVIIEQKSHLVEEKQKEIVDSITYAKRLQQAILPPLNQIHQHFPDSFVLYRPKDIVAGDFYWMYAAGNAVLIAAADCTGHGVPGALVSVVCSNALNRTVKEFGLTDTGKILDKVTDLVLETFEKSGEEIKDGMDISLLSIQKSGIQWSGANNPLWIINGNNLTEIKADKQPIGKSEHRKPFTTHTLNLIKGETLYLFTDGYADQFNLERKKLMKKKFKEMLLSIQDKLMQEQKQFLEDHHLQWQGNMEQTDDLTVIGIRIA